MKKILFTIIFLLILFVSANITQARVVTGDGEIIAYPDATPDQITVQPVVQPTEKPTSAPSIIASEETLAPVLSESPEPSHTVEPTPTETPIPTPAPTPTPSLEPASLFESEDIDDDEEEKKIQLDFAIDKALGVEMVEVKGGDDYREVVLIDDEGIGRISVPIDNINDLSFVLAASNELSPKGIAEKANPDEYQPKGQDEIENGEESGSGNKQSIAQGMFIIAVFGIFAIFLIYRKIKKGKGDDDSTVYMDDEGKMDMEEEDNEREEQQSKRKGRRVEKNDKSGRKTKRFKFRNGTVEAPLEEDSISALLSKIRNQCSSMNIEIQETPERFEFAYSIENDDGTYDALHCVLNLDQADETDIERRASDLSNFLDMVKSGECALTRGDLLELESEIRGLSHSVLDENGQRQYVFWF